MRTVLPERERPWRPETRQCEVAGCTRTTRERKPYCSAHVAQHPYVQHIMSLLDDVADEHARVLEEGPRAVDVQGITVQEIVQVLEQQGQRSVPRLAKDLNLDVRVMSGYVKALHLHEMVHLSLNERRTTQVSLSPVGQRAASPLQPKRIRRRASA